MISALNIGRCVRVVADNPGEVDARPVLVLDTVENQEEDGHKDDQDGHGHTHPDHHLQGQHLDKNVSR